MKKFSVLLLLFVCCNHKTPLGIETDTDFIHYNVAKWYQNHPSAITLTYDIGLGTAEHPYTKAMINQAITEVRNRNLRMDFEMVTGYYYQNEERSPWLDTIRTILIPNGIHFFGHGHWHINHDEVSYSEAFESFQLCMTLMKEWDLNPKVYAYPESAGLEKETQQANHDAGFIAARGSTYNREEYYICANDEEEPKNWYYLPSVPIASNERSDYVRTHEEVVEIIDKSLNNNSWIILMYHGVGLPNLWGYYPFDEYISDLDYIVDKDFWKGNFDDVTIYIQERNAFSINYSKISQSEKESKYSITFQDGLDNTIYNHPLTVELVFNEETKVKEVCFSPAIDLCEVYQAVENTITMDVIPDERTYTMEIHFN